MSFVLNGILVYLLVGGGTGLIAFSLAPQNRTVWTDIVVGIVGAVLGDVLAQLVGIRYGSLLGLIYITTLGAALLLMVARKATLLSHS